MDGNYEKNIYNNLIEYYKKEYNKIIKLDINLKLIEKISNNKNIKYNYEYSSINNFIDILNIKMNIQVDRINSLCSVFKIKKGDKIINYAYLFSMVDTNKYKEYKNNNKKITDVIEHSFVTTSPNLISMDGEFRHRLIDITNIYLLNKYTSLINYLEKYIYTKFENEDINILYEYFNIYDKQLETLLYDNIINTKITMKLFIISWLCEIMNIINNTKQININDDYYNIMYTKKDITIIKNYINNKTNLNNINEFINDFTYVNNISHKLELSQKIIPQSNYEFKNYSKLITRIGTELLINNIVTNLKYNLVSNSFSMFYNWFFISNSRKTLYDNENIIKFIEYNELNKNILNYLFNSKTELNNINNNDNISNKQIYTKLLNNINTNIKIIEQKLLMADISSCFIFEYIGKTFYNNINNINIYNLLFNDYNLFSKIIFDIIYGLYCLNINGIIHGDLHLNNITINNRYIDKQKDSYILYNLNSNIHENIIEHINKINNNVYLFEDNSYTACIIDYSRSYIMLKSINEDILEKYKNKSRNEFIKEEKKRYIKDLSHLFPNYVNNNKHKIDILFNTINFEKFFIYFSAIDIFKFSTNLLLYLDNKKLTYNKKIYDLLVNISKESYNYLEKIINDNSYLDSSELKSYPNYIILNKYFKDFEISNIKEKKDIKNISNIFNFDNINLTNNVYKHKYFDFHITDKDKKIINNEKNINYKKDFIINNNDNNINLEKFINENLYNYKFKNMNNINTNNTLIDTSMINLTDTLN